MKDSQIVAKSTKLDLQDLLARVEDDRELLRDLLLIFLEEFPRHFQALQQAVAQGNTSQTRMVSHTLKGMLANLGVRQGADSAAVLEDIARKNESASLQTAFANFAADVEGLLQEVERHLAN